MGQVPSLEGTDYVVELSWLVASGLSAIASFTQFTMLMYQTKPWRCEKRYLMKHYPQLLLTQLAVATFLSSVFYLLSAFQPTKDQAFLCGLQFVLATLPDLTSDLLVCGLCVTLLLLFWKSGFFHQSSVLRAFLRRLFAATVIICWGAPAIVCIIALANGWQGMGVNTPHWCWIEDKYYNAFAITYYSFGNFAILFNIVLFIVMYFKRRQIGSFQFQLMWYIPAFVLVYTPATINRLLFICGSQSIPALTVVAACTLPLQGAVFFVVYLIIHFRWRTSLKSGESLRLVSDQYQPRTMSAFGNDMFFYIEESDDEEASSLNSERRYQSTQAEDVLQH